MVGPSSASGDAWEPIRQHLRDPSYGVDVGPGRQQCWCLSAIRRLTRSSRGASSWPSSRSGRLWPFRRFRGRGSLAATGQMRSMRGSMRSLVLSLTAARSSLTGTGCSSSEKGAEARSVLAFREGPVAQPSPHDSVGRAVGWGTHPRMKGRRRSMLVGGPDLSDSSICRSCRSSAPS